MSAKIENQAMLDWPSDSTKPTARSGPKARIRRCRPPERWIGRRPCCPPEAMQRDARRLQVENRGTRTDQSCGDENDRVRRRGGQGHGVQASERDAHACGQEIRFGMSITLYSPTSGWSSEEVNVAVKAINPTWLKSKRKAISEQGIKSRKKGLHRVVEEMADTRRRAGF